MKFYFQFPQKIHWQKNPRKGGPLLFLVVLFSLFPLFPTALHSALLFSKDFNGLRVHLVSTQPGSIHRLFDSLGYYLLGVGVTNLSEKSVLLDAKDPWDFYEFKKPYHRLPETQPPLIDNLFKNVGLTTISSHLWRSVTLAPGERDYFFLILPNSLPLHKITGVRYTSQFFKQSLTFGLFQLPSDYAPPIKKEVVQVVVSEEDSKFKLPEIIKQPIQEDLSFLEIHNQFNFASTLSNAEKGEKWKSLVGVGVRWTGIIKGVSSHFGYPKYLLDVGLLNSTSHDTEVIFENPEFVGPKTIGSTLSFIGYLWDFKPDKPFIIYVTRAVPE